MIDFQNAKFLKLSPASEDAYAKHLNLFLIEGEIVVGCYKTVRDGVVFTNKRIITVNTQGVTGKKKDFSSLPYSKIQAYSVETAGVFDMDSELEIWFSGLGSVRFEFAAKVDIAKICRVISECTLC